MSDRPELAEAFEQAAEARAAIASIVDRVRSGGLDLNAAFVLADQEPLIGRTFAVKVLEVVPGIGKVRARRTMQDIGIADDAWLNDVTIDHRAAVVAAFGETT